MKFLYYLAMQRIPPRGKNDGNDNLKQLLLLLGKHNSYIAERLFSKVCGNKCHTYQDFQNEMLHIMSNLLRRSKRCDLNNNNF